MMITPAAESLADFRGVQHSRNYVNNAARSSSQAAKQLYRTNYRGNMRYNNLPNRNYINTIQGQTRQVQNQLFGNTSGSYRQQDYNYRQPARDNQAQQYQNWKNQVIQKSYGNQKR
jgi:hypothetical protein